MTEETNTETGQQTTVPAQQSVDWESRYKGTVSKIDELVKQQKQLQAELAEKASLLEQLNGQLSLKDVEKTAAVSERDKSIETLVTASQAAEKELARLKALELKVKVSKEMKKPELIGILDTIPDVTDEEALKTIMGSIAGFADTLVKQREEQLLAGITTVAGTAAGGSPSEPASDEAWKKRIEGLPLGSRERSAALEAYGGWLNTTHSRR